MRQRSDGVVILSYYVTGDASVLCDVGHDPEHRRRFDFPGDFLPSLQHSEAVIARWERERLAGIRFAFAIREVGSGRVIGGCELKPGVSGTANLSYWIHPAHRRRGIGTRAVALSCKIAFGEMSLLRLEVLTDPDNVGSRQTAVHNGFRKVGVREGRDLYILDATEVAEGGAKVDGGSPDGC